MNFSELMHVIKNQEWVVENINAQGNSITITMARGGILVITFNEDGTLSFPSNIPFFPPEYHHWCFDEATQQIKLFNQIDEVTSIFEIPKLIATDHLVMETQDQQTKRRLIAYPRLRRNIYDADTPNIPINAGNMIMAFQYSPDSELHQVVENEGLRVHRIDNDPKSFKGLCELFDYLIGHPRLEQVAIINNAEWKSNPLDLAVPDSIRLNKGNFALIGSRAMIIEVIGKVLIECNHEAYSQQFVEDENYTVSVKDVLEKYFSKRLRTSSI